MLAITVMMEMMIGGEAIQMVVAIAIILIAAVVTAASPTIVVMIGGWTAGMTIATAIIPIVVVVAAIVPTIAVMTMIG